MEIVNFSSMQSGRSTDLYLFAQAISSLEDFMIVCLFRNERSLAQFNKQFKADLTVNKNILMTCYNRNMNLTILLGQNLNGKKAVFLIDDFDLWSKEESQWLYNTSSIFKAIIFSIKTKTSPIFSNQSI